MIVYVPMYYCLPVGYIRLQRCLMMFTYISVMYGLIWIRCGDTANLLRMEHGPMAVDQKNVV